MQKKYGLVDLFRIPYKANSWLFFIKIFEYIVYGLLPLVEFYAISEFINISTYIIIDKSFNRILFPMILLILVIGLKHLSQQIFKLATYKLDLEVDKYLKMIFINKKARIEYMHIENKDMYDKANRLSKDSGQRILNGLNAILNIIIILVKLSISICIITKYLGMKSLIFVLISIPIVLLAAYNGKINYRNTKSLTYDSRIMEYISSVLTDKQYCEERSLFNYSDNLNNRWKKLNNHKTNKTYSVIARLFLRMDVSAILMIFLSGIIIYIFTLKAVSGVVTLGTIIALTNLLKDLSEQFRWGMMDNITTVAENKVYFSEFDEFMNLSEEKNAIEKRSFTNFHPSTIELKNLSFSYPSSNKKILHNINFQFENGKHYAIVGKNGSGKTTLIKLLTGMYKNYEGEILVDNVELKNLGVNDIRNIYSIVYQDFAKYPIDIKSNVVFGNIVKNIDCKKLDECLLSVNMYDFINKLPNKESTYVGKVKKGSVDLSGGQWQKLAMARAIYNPSKIRILDEPTAALDPMAESELYENFGVLSKDDTSIFISHRLGSVKLSDTIIVLDNGEIVESGSHLELMKSKKLYYQLYCDQRSWYKDEKEA